MPYNNEKNGLSSEKNNELPEKIDLHWQAGKECGQFCNQEKTGFLLKAFALFGKEKH